VAPRKAQLSQAQIVERLFRVDPDTSARWQELPPRALNFLHQLLELNPDKRLTATEALDHSWFKKPLAEAALLEERYEKVIRFWRKRDCDDVIENLPSRVPASQGDQIVTSASKSRRRIPDITLSPYFGLERHLQPKLASKRKIILDSLNESGSTFLVNEENHNKTGFANPTTQVRDLVSIETVKGIDLFGSFRSSNAVSQVESDLDEICLVPTAFMPHCERDFGFHTSDSLKGLSSATEVRDVGVGEGRVGTGKRKRSRPESENAADRNIRDRVADALPRYGTAKALKDAVEKKKQEMESINLAGLAIRSSVRAA
jgi:serine/threonine protein kinase